MKRNEYAEQVLNNISVLLAQMGMKGYDVVVSMKIIITVLVEMVDTQAKADLMLKSIVEAHNSQAIIFLPAINNTIN